MNVTLVDYTQDSESKIAQFSAICYDADTGEDANARRIKKLLSLGHLATLRFASATFLVERVSRTCSHQFVRTKHLDFLQESQRYVDQTKIDFIEPPNIGDNLEASCLFARLQMDSKDIYQRLRKLGIRKEDARFALLEASPTRFYVTGNFQAWRDFLRNRTDKSAQWEIRQCAELIGQQLYQIAPNVFEEYNGKEKDS
jgi:thymidylate synthase (FAD)